MARSLADAEVKAFDPLATEEARTLQLATAESVQQSERDGAQRVARVRT